MARSINLLQFETNTACNASCAFCAHKKMKRTGFMETWQIADLTFHLAKYASEICPFWMQEPLLETRLPQVLSNCKANNPKAKTNIFTNMGTYPHKMLTRIFNAGTLDVLAISFYGENKWQYEELQPPLQYETTIGNIKKAVKLRNRLGWGLPRIMLRQLITSPNLPQRHLNKWANIVDGVELFRMDNWCGENQIYNDKKEREIWGAKPDRVPCSQLYGCMYINSNGDVPICCLDHEGKHTVGNVFDNGYDVWFRSPQLEYYRALHEQGRWNEIDICRRCNQWEYREYESWKQKWKKPLTASSATNPSTSSA